MENSKDIFIFNQWLVRLDDFESVLKYLPASKAKMDENLFKLRMSALVRAGDFERIHAEISNAPLISSAWKLVIESRAFAMTGHYEDAIKSLDRLIPIIESDPRDVDSICQYLEASRDIKGLCHLLEYFSNKPIHAKYALSRLIQYRAGSAHSHELVVWLEKLAELSPQDVTLQVAILYLNLLDTQLISPSTKLNGLIENAEDLVEQTNLPQARISLALAHLRNNAPDVALVALGPAENWRSWIDSRPAWSFIASQVFRLNHDSEKSLILAQNLDTASFDFAEKESFKVLFPSSFRN